MALTRLTPCNNTVVTVTYVSVVHIVYRGLRVVRVKCIGFELFNPIKRASESESFSRKERHQLVNALQIIFFYKSFNSVRKLYSFNCCYNSIH